MSFGIAASQTQTETLTDLIRMRGLWFYLVRFWLLQRERRALNHFYCGPSSRLHQQPQVHRVPQWPGEEAIKTSLFSFETRLKQSFKHKSSLSWMKSASGLTAATRNNVPSLAIFKMRNSSVWALRFWMDIGRTTRGAGKS